MTAAACAPVAHRFVIASSWWVASELVRRNPDLRLIETHPGGGQYDCLSVVRRVAGSWTTLIDLNRAGSMHVHQIAADQAFEPLTWDSTFRNDDAHDAVKRLEAAAGLAPPKPSPPTGAAAVTFRVIARLLAGTVNDRRQWDVRNEQQDTSGGEYGRGNYVDALPQLADALDDRRDDDVLGVSRYRYWALLSDAELRAVFDTDGAVHLLNGQSHDLLRLYRYHGRSLTAVLGAALGKLLP